MADKWAERVLDMIAEHPGGLTMPRLLELTDLTSGQYRRAYNWTLDTFGEPFWAKTIVGRQVVYMSTEDAAACSEDWDRTIRTQITRARREYHKAHAFATAHPGLVNDEQEVYARRRLEDLQLAQRRLVEQLT